ncbi:MAG: hypothetical protein EXR37_09535 [Limnohabitans sp.]|nr:hypothetical protein [Limnohabitans sp.]
MNTWLPWLSATSLLPALPVQQLFHTFGWLALLSWYSVAFVPVQDRRWRWLVCSLFWGLLMLCWGGLLSALGLAFQSPGLLTLCLCLLAAWRDMRSTPHRLFYATRPAEAGAWLWLIITLTGWLLLLDAFGQLPADLYPSGFSLGIVWFAWSTAMLWLLLAYWLDAEEWQVQAAGCWLLATGLFVFTRAPSGNAWDAWLDPWLWLFAHAKLLRLWWFQRMRSSHS